MKAELMNLETRWDDVMMQEFWIAVISFEKKPPLVFNKDIEVKQK